MNEMHLDSGVRACYNEGMGDAWDRYKRGEITKYQYRMLIGDEKARVKKWVADNQERSRENARRRMEKFRANHGGTNGYFDRWEQASPPWLTDKHWEEMYELYRIADEMTKATGIQHVVDHIEPLKGKNSSGLNVPWNLQVLTQAENNYKGNKFPI